MTVLALVFGAAILLTLMLVSSYSGRDARPARRTRSPHSSDGGNVAWMSNGSDSSAGDCGGGDGGGGCGDGGGGGGGGD